MATHSSIIAWRILMDRGAWRATVHRITASDRTESLSTAQHIHIYTCVCVCVCVCVCMHVCIHTHIFNSRKLQKARHLKFPFSPPKYLPDPGIKPTSLASPASTGRLFTTAPRGKLLLQIVILPDDIILYRGSFLGRGKQRHVRLFLVCWW